MRDSLPAKIEHEFVVFESFFRCGFNIPPSKVFLNVLDRYQIELHHLNPNSITMLSVFVHLCEAFFGIEASLNLFQYFYKLKRITENKCVRGCGFQLRSGMKNSYILVPVTSS